MNNPTVTGSDLLREVVRVRSKIPGASAMIARDIGEQPRGRRPWQSVSVAAMCYGRLAEHRPGMAEMKPRLIIVGFETNR